MAGNLGGSRQLSSGQSLRYGSDAGRTKLLFVVHSPMTSALNAEFYPHIIDTIIDYAIADDKEPAPLIKLGQVCRDWHERISRKIGYHLKTVCYSIEPDHDEYVKRWDAAHDVRTKGKSERQVTEPLDLETWQKHWKHDEYDEDWTIDGSLEFETLRPALYPGRDVCDFDTQESVPLVREAKVLTASTFIYNKWFCEQMAKYCPKLRTVRIISNVPPFVLPLYPPARTYVWFRAPDAHLGVNDREFMPNICHPDTKKIVFVNDKRCRWHNDVFPKMEAKPQVHRPPNVSETIFYLYDRPNDGIQHWIQWSVDCGFRTTVVLETETADECREELKRLASGLMETDSVDIITAEAYRDRVGDEIFREETRYYILPTELANREQLQVCSTERDEQSRPWRVFYDGSYNDRPAYKPDYSDFDLTPYL